MRLVTFGSPGNWTAGIEIDGRVVTLDEAARAAGWAETGLTNRRLLGMGPAKMAELAGAAATLPRPLHFQRAAATATDGSMSPSRARASRVATTTDSASVLK
jgi:hypothetical protein